MSDNRLELSRTLGERLAYKRQPGDEKAFADAILAQLAQDRLLWVVASGGDDEPPLSLHDTAQITSEIARLSGSAGLIYAMHMSQALTLVRHSGNSAFLQGLLQRLVRDQVLVASGTSEKGVGGNIFGSVCTVAEGADGQLTIQKDSPNISYLDHAGAILITAIQPTSSDQTTQVLVAAEMDNITLQPGAAAGFLGMRGILNRPWAVTATFCKEAIFPTAYPQIARDTMTPSVHILWAALWSGLAGAALDKAKVAIAKAPAADKEAAEIIRGELSRLVDKHFMMNALVRDAIVAFDGDALQSDGMGMVHTARVKRLKVVCSDLLTDICLGALGLIGLPGYAEDGPLSLSEIVRDALSARVMISNYRLLASNAPIERYLTDKL
jgi:acyl-CoA dehydrogenase